MTNRDVRRFLCASAMMQSVAFGLALGAAWNEAKADEGGKEFRTRFHKLLQRAEDNFYDCAERVSDSTHAIANHAALIAASVEGRPERDWVLYVLDTTVGIDPAAAREMAAVIGYKPSDALAEMNQQGLAFNEECSIPKGRIDDAFGRLMREHDERWGRGGSPLTAKDVEEQLRVAGMMMAGVRIEREHLRERQVFIQTTRQIIAEQETRALMALVEDYKTMLDECEPILDEAEARLEHFEETIGAGAAAQGRAAGRALRARRGGALVAAVGWLAGSAAEEAAKKVDESIGLLNACGEERMMLDTRWMEHQAMQSGFAPSPDAQTRLDQVAARDDAFGPRFNRFVAKANAYAGE